MFSRLKNLLSKGARKAAPSASLPDGKRVYAVGDIHGRMDLLAALIDAIDVDDAARHAAGDTADTTCILLGDLVDRGPDSAGVIALARAWQKRRKVRILAGNHEEMFLKSFASTDILRHFLRHGGRDTLFSYGVERKAYSSATVEQVQGLMDRHVPQADRDFITGFEDMIEIGDYLFVHAGIEPGVPIAEQSIADLRWIREPFLSFAEPHGVVVVHGHTITDDPVDNGNRIGIDTGAYASGRLTALVLEGETRRYIAAVQDEEGAIAIEQLDACAA